MGCGEFTSGENNVKKSNAGEQVVTVDRRRGDRREVAEPQATTAAPPERRKKNRRRQIDPTTCERDYSDDEVEFMQALDAYKRAAGRMFPTCSEILEVIRALGYAKTNEEHACSGSCQDCENA